MSLQTFMVTLILMLPSSSRVVFCLEPSQCIAPMGMETGGIKDEDIIASSSFDHGNVGPHHGRVRNELNAGAWCPQTPATPELKEWLEVNLHTVHLITATETQGRFGNGRGVEYAENYVLEYWRPRLNKWIRYRNRSGSEIMQGNINTYLESKVELDPPIWATKIRFLPYSRHGRTVCMRVELYGCKWSDGIVSYSMPQGDKRGSSWEFYDTSYDGHWDGEMLKYGLGQLTDGEVAPDDFKIALYQPNNVQGWVGWRNDTATRGAEPVNIVFEFDRVREFTAVHIFTNNQFMKEVQVFAQAKVWFSVAGKRYKGEPITFDYIEDSIWEKGRNVSIRLHHRVGRFVKLQLFFASRWIMISEVTFESSPVHGNFTDEEPALNSEDDNNDNDNNNELAQKDQNPSIEPPVLDRTNVISAPSDFGQYLGIVVGVLSVLVVLVVLVFVVVQQRRYKSSPRPSHQMPPDKAALYREPSFAHLPGGSNAGGCGSSSSEYAEYAVPLQTTTQPSVRLTPPPPQLQNFLASKIPPPPPQEQYYAATEICGGVVGNNTGFVPPPPPLTTPPPVRVATRQPRYVSALSRTYVGP